jgi:DNA end-binding protein Ku
MARPIWTGSIAFGLVTIPVEVHTAVRDHRPRFRLLHARDRSPVNYERVCQKDGKKVAWEDLVKGFEYAKGRFVVLTKEDLSAAALEKTRRIDILDFVESGAIDDRYFDKPYYLTPGRGGDASYALLREAIRAAGRVGIAKFILRDAQHLAAVEAIGDALVLSTLRFADELVDEEALSFPAAKGLRKADLKLAQTLIGHLATDWKPEKYTDDYRDNLMRVIEAKMQGEEADLEEEAPKRPANVVDLMERLRQSLAEAGGGVNRSGAGRSGRSEGRRRTRSASRATGRGEAGKARSPRRRRAS